MKIEDLEAFVAAVESETFFTSEGEAHRFQPSASNEVIALEKEFGTELFQRIGTNSGILTDAGKTLLHEAKPLIRQYRYTMRKMDRYRSKEEQALIIGTLPILRQYRLTPLFRRFKDEHPNVDLRIEETDGNNLVTGLRDDYYDAIIVRKSMIADIDVDYYRLAADEMAAILWSDHQHASDSTIRLETLKNEVFYLTNPYTPAYGLCWKLLKDRHISTENVRTASVDQILPVVAEKNGVGLLPISNLNVSKQSGVVAIPLEPRATLEVVFAFRPDVQVSDDMRDLKEMIETRSKAVPAV